MIYRNSTSGKYADLNSCPKCKEPRYKHGDGRVPRKQFTYLPLELRLKRLFGHKRTSQPLQQHLNHRDSGLMSISGMHESEAWKEWFGPGGIFRGQKQGVALGMCLDGVNPYSKGNTSYSMWPIVLFPLNLPENVRRSSSSMVLVGIIPGPGEPMEFDPYMEVVVDDIFSLNKLEMYDAHSNSTFKLSTNICLHIFDYPGQNKILHCQGML